MNKRRWYRRPPEFQYCCIPGCTRKLDRHAFRDMCQLHYQRWRRTGDPLKTTTTPPSEHSPTCSVEGCNKPYHAKGFCQIHYTRNYHGIDMNLPPPKRLDKGYPVVPDGKGGKLLVHRLVMEKMLGRKLKRDELVHHIDGNPLNFEPDNLEVITKSEHFRSHLLVRGIGSLDDKGIKHLNGHLKKYGLHIAFQRSFQL